MSKRKASEFFRDFEGPDIAEAEKRSYDVDTSGSRPILRSRNDEAPPILKKLATDPVVLDEFGRIAKPGTKDVVSQFLEETLGTKHHSHSRHSRNQNNRNDEHFAKGKMGLGFTDSKVESRGRGKASTLPAWMTDQSSKQGSTSWDTETKVSVPGNSWMRTDMQQASSILINDEIRVTGMSDARGLTQVNNDARRDEITRAINDDGVFSINHFYEPQQSSATTVNLPHSIGSDLAHHDAIFTAITKLNKPATVSNVAPYTAPASTVKSMGKEYVSEYVNECLKQKTSIGFMKTLDATVTKKDQEAKEEEEINMPLFKVLKARDRIIAKYAWDKKYYPATIKAVMHGGYFSAQYDIIFDGYSSVETVSWEDVQQKLPAKSEPIPLQHSVNDVDSYKSGSSRKVLPPPPPPPIIINKPNTSRFSEATTRAGAGVGVGAGVGQAEAKSISETNLGLSSSKTMGVGVESEGGPDLGQGGRNSLVLLAPSARCPTVGPQSTEPIKSTPTSTATFSSSGLKSDPNTSAAQPPASINPKLLTRTRGNWKSKK